MYIVVIGLGEVGRHLLEVFDQEGHDVVAVDRNADAVDYAAEHHDVASLVGYGASQEVLDRANVHKSDLVVAVSDHDEVNLIAALAAKQLGARRVIARAQGNEWAQWTDGIRYGLLGVDVVINPRVLVAQELAKIARSHGASNVIDLAQDRVELVRIVMSASRLANKPLSKIELPHQTLVAAVVRGGELFVPGGADVLLPEDRVYLIGQPEHILAAEDVFTSQREARRVCVVGGGVVGTALARELLRQEAQVLLIERDAELAQTVAAELADVQVAHGDGTDQRLLAELEVGSYDLFCATTSADEVNLMAVLIGKGAGVARTAAVVKRADYVSIYRQLGIDIVLSPRTVASDHILRFSRSETLHSLTVIEDGQAEVLELTAGMGCRAAQTPLRRLDLPRGALVGAIIHRDQVTIPGGDDVVHAGDRVVVMTTNDARPGVERIFRPRGRRT